MMLEKRLSKLEASRRHGTLFSGRTAHSASGADHSWRLQIQIRG